jgi:hypothetical protein
VSRLASYRPEGTGVAQMLRDCPEFGSLPPHTLKVLAWAYRYTEDVPTRDEIMRAMTALASRFK